MYDIIIAGGGPAGLTATVYSARKKLSALLICKEMGGQVIWTNNIENYMGYQFIEGPELMRKFEEQVKQFPIEIKPNTAVVKIKTLDHGFEVNTDKASYQGKTLVVATGKKPRSLNVPGESLLIGRGISFCATCDGPLFAGMDVAVVGGGNSALEVTNDMIKIANQVYLVSLTQLTADPVLIDKAKNAKNLKILLGYEVVEITGDKFVNGIKIRDTQTRQEELLKVGGVFIEIGLVPNSDPVKGLVSLNNLGEIEVNCSNETNVPGLFAAGDVTNSPEKQIVIAAGEGAKAALSAHRYLQRLKE